MRTDMGSSPKMHTQILMRQCLSTPQPGGGGGNGLMSHIPANTDELKNHHF